MLKQIQPEISSWFHLRGNPRMPNGGWRNGHCNPRSIPAKYPDCRNLRV